MGLVFTALVPVFLTIALGVGLRRSLLPNGAHWEGLERLTYFILFPALLFISAVRADLSEVNVVAVCGALISALVLLSGGIVLFHKRLVTALATDGPAFTSLFQGAVRWNTYITFAVVGGLFGTKGITVAAIAVVVMIPLVNIFSVLVLARFVGRAPPTAGYVLGQLVRNPFIWACGLGILVDVMAIPLPRVLLEFMDILGRASLALGLIVVGGGLDLKALARPPAVVLMSLALKLVVKPILAVAFALAFGLSGLELAVVAIAAAVPSAPNGYVLARQMGGDAPLLAQMLTLQIIAAAATLPVVIWLADRIG